MTSTSLAFASRFVSAPTACGCICAIMAAARPWSAGRLPSRPVAQCRRFRPARGSAGKRRGGAKTPCRDARLSRPRTISDFDPDWRHYDLNVETADIEAMLTAARSACGDLRRHLARRLPRHVARGAPPGLLRGAVLNDIGPVIEPQGFTRIRHYLRDQDRAGLARRRDRLRAKDHERAIPRPHRGGFRSACPRQLRESRRKLRPHLRSELVKPLIVCASTSRCRRSGRSSTRSPTSPFSSFAAAIPMCSRRDAHRNGPPSQALRDLYRRRARPCAATL